MMTLDKVRKLLALAERNPDENEKASARKRALRELNKLGLTEEDTVMTECTLLSRGRKPWEEALADIVHAVHPVELRIRIDKDEATNVLLVRGSVIDVNLVESRFNVLRRSVLKLSGNYQRKLAPFIYEGDVPAVVEVFCNNFIIALALRILDDEIEDEEVEQLEKERSTAPADEPSRKKSDYDLEEEPRLEIPEEEDDSDKADGLFDKLLEIVSNAPDIHVPFDKLDPAVCGYQAGISAPLSSAIPAETTVTNEAARLLTKREREEIKSTSTPSAQPTEPDPFSTW